MYRIVITILILTSSFSGICQTLSDSVYTDPKSFFAFRLPENWVLKEFPSDPRGKIALDDGKVNGCAINVLVQYHSISGFDELCSRITSNVSNMGVNAKYDTLTLKTYRIHKCQFTAPMSGQTRERVGFRFLAGGTYHDIQFSFAPGSQSKYKAFMANFLNSYYVLNTSKDEDMAGVHQAAKYYRLSQLALQVNDTLSALEFVESGLEHDSTNKELNSLRMKLKR